MNTLFNKLVEHPGFTPGALQELEKADLTAEQEKQFLFMALAHLKYDRLASFHAKTYIAIVKDPQKFIEVYFAGLEKDTVSLSVLMEK